MSPGSIPIFETHRLIIRTASAQDAEVLYRLWTDPLVMTHVGFPQGLRITPQVIADQIAASEESVFDQYLIVELKSSGESIGECKMIRPDADGLAETDVKLLPAFWGHKYGVEIKQGLLDYLFAHTDAKEVQATPNVNNVASIKMQEAVGGVCMGERTFEFPVSMQSYTQPVHSYIYRVNREDWAKRKGGNPMIGQRISAGGIVIRDNKVLLVRLTKEGEYDFWVLPGGGIEGAEGIFKAAEREVWEETGLTVRPERIAYVQDFLDGGKYVCKFWVVCTWVSGELTLDHKVATEDVLVDVGFFSEEELQGMKAYPLILKDEFWQDAEAGFPTIRYLGYG